MPSLEEMRRWLAGESVPGFPERDLSPVEATPSGNGWMEVGNFLYHPATDDVILLFGAFESRKFSDMVKRSNGRSYLRWLISKSENWPDRRIVDAAKTQLKIWEGSKKR